MKKTIYFLLLLAFAAYSLPAGAQQGAAGQAFSLKESIAYALENQPELKNAQLQTDIARSRIGQIRSMGLPQINAGVDIQNNFLIQKNLVDLSAFGAGENVITLKKSDLDQVNANQDVELVAKFRQLEEKPAPFYAGVAFGLQHTGSAAFSASQLLFDGSYLIGLKAAKVYTDLATKQAQQTEIDIIERVTKAYYGVLVTGERIALLDRNLLRLEKLLRETTEIQKQGFAEKIDVDRLQVSYNNLKVEKDKADRLQTLSVDLLKFQMSLDLNQPIELSDKLDNAVVDARAVAASNFDYGQRIEYSILETQRDLSLLDVRNRQAGYFPKLFLNARYGYGGSDVTFRHLMRFQTKNTDGDYQSWFPFGTVGVSLQIPVFDGFRKKYEVQQAKLTVETINNSFKTLKQSIDLQMRQSTTSLQNALQVLESQKQSLELAQEVARVSNIKFQEGVGSNLEVVTAETELRQAQTNYYSALYDALIAKVELQKATGTLSK